MRKKLFSLALVFCLVFSLSACSNVNGTTSDNKAETDSKKDGDAIDEKMVQTVRDAAKKLKDTYTDYIVSTTMQAPDGNITYLNVQHGDVNYTEYSVDDDKNVGTIAYGEKDDINYLMTDYVDNNGICYLFQSDSDGNPVVYKLPRTYTKYVKDRGMLYTNDLLDNVMSSIDLGIDEESNEKIHRFKFKIKNDCIKSILGLSSYCIYSSILDSQDISSEHIKKLCKYYLEDINMNLTFSDAVLIVGVDSNNILKYVSFEVGGLGSRLYFTEEVVSTTNDNIRDKPDLTKTVNFENSLKDIADYISGYDNYDDAVKALEQYKKGGSSFDDKKEDDAKD